MCMISLGSIAQLHCGKAEDVMQQMEQESVDLTVTSPPYDNLRKYNGFDWNFETMAEELFRLTKKHGVVVWIVGDETIHGSETGSSFKQALYFKEIGFNLWDTMIYEKSGMSFPGSSKRYFNVFDYMFVFSKGIPKTVNLIKDRKNKYIGITGGNHRGGLCERNQYGRRFNIWRYANGKFNSSKDLVAFQHPAIFPEALARDHILTWSNEDDFVFDPMMGSGTTGKMAIMLRRRFIGVEISQQYFDEIAVPRCRTAYEITLHNDH